MKKRPCPYCGDIENNSGIGWWCKKHAEDVKNGKLTYCKECDQWHYKDEPCKFIKIIYTELPTEGFEKCVICEKSTNGYAFCRKCFKEHTEEELLSILNKFNSISEQKVEELNSSDISIQKYTELPTEGFDKCVICERSTNGYAFCRKCFKDHSEEELLSILNSVFISNVDSKNTEIINNEEIGENNVVIIDNNNKSRCITCGKQTDGLLFCSNCFYKYKNKELLLKITNCTNVELLDEDYEGRFSCKDGHVVKSKSERAIDDYLFENGIFHAYERELAYGASEKEVLHPDFYLPNYLGEGKDVYIEHWGYNENNIKYTNTKKFKMPIYKKLGITLICTYEKTDIGKIYAVLDRKLNKKFINENQVNFEENTSDSHIDSSSDTLPF